MPEPGGSIGLIVADESVDFNIVKELRAQGYEVEAVVEGSAGVSDPEVLRMANQRGALLLTEDKDFGELTYRLRKSSRGIILLRMSGADLANRMRALYQLFAHYDEKLSTSFCVVTVKKIRVIPLDQ